MIEIRLSGVKRFTAKNKKLAAYIRNQFAPEVVKDGHRFAKEIAPRDTGALMRAIKGNVKKISGTVYVIQPAGTTRPYHLWMHGIRAPMAGKGAGGGYDTSSGKYAPKSGKFGPQFMYVTQEYMTKQSGERFKKKFRSIY